MIGTDHKLCVIKVRLTQGTRAHGVQIFFSCYMGYFVGELGLVKKQLTKGGSS